ncbi:MAG: hypothetical protein NVS4B3_27060 [Gemmatimonadaceae bacterium]
MVRLHLHGRGRRGPALAPAVGLVAFAGIAVACASFHQDNPLVELNRAMDKMKVHAFPGSTRL